MPKFGGRGSLTLFNVESEVDKEIRILSTERLLEKLGLAKPESKSVGGFDMPLIPSQEDFFLFPFRHLSATIVGGGSWKATDFSIKGVLEKSTPLLKGKPAYLNHNQEVGKEIGVIGECEYVQGNMQKGLKIPGGIEGPFMLDSKLAGNADLIRKLSSPISPITSCSVSVIFEWESSHDFEFEGDFSWKLGEIIDGEMVRRVVTNILDYAESSMVWLGADPYAKMLDSKGKLINIDRSAAYAKNKFSELTDNQKYESERSYFVFNCLDEKKFLHLSTSSEKFLKPETQKDPIMNEEILLFIAAGCGVTVEDLKAGKFNKAQADKFKIVASDSFAKMKTEEDFNKLAGEKKIAEDAVTALKLEKTNFETEIAALKLDKTKLEPMATVGTTVLAAAKVEAKRVYGLFAKGKEEKSIVDRIEAETDLVKLDADIKTFGGKSVTEYGGHCGACGSSDIKFRLSITKEDGNPGDGSEAKKYSLADAANR